MERQLLLKGLHLLKILNLHIARNVDHLPYHKPLDCLLTNRREFKPNRASLNVLRPFSICVALPKTPLSPNNTHSVQLSQLLELHLKLENRFLRMLGWRFNEATCLNFLNNYFKASWENDLRRWAIFTEPLGCLHY